MRASQTPPNVLVFMTDQQSALLLGPVRRPAWESLRARGVEFTRAFCNTPQCSPARASLLTGLEPHHAGVVTNVDPESLGRPLAPTLTTAGKVFRDAGYSTGYFGKWHLTNEKEPLDQFGFNTSVHGRDPVVAQNAAEWIRKQSGPWLAWVSVLNPHDIYQITDRLKSTPIRPGVRVPATGSSHLRSGPAAQWKYMTDDQGKPTLNWTAEDWLRYRSFYCELVEKADACFATVLKAVTDPARTVVVYTSDHGDALGEHGLPFKGPFMYEPLIRIPLVIAAPGLQAGSQSDRFARSVDLAPTLAALAGVRWNGATDGRNLFQGSGPDAVFLEYFGKQHWAAPIRTVRERRWKLNRYRDGGAELYDLENDPTEARNLADAASQAGERKRLESTLDKWWAGDSAGPRESAALPVTISG